MNLRNYQVNGLLRSCVVNKTSSEKEVVTQPATQSSLDVEVRMGFCNNFSPLFINARLAGHCAKYCGCEFG